MSRKNKKDDELDTETTFADMNVEGFDWYDPSAKKDKKVKRPRQKVSRREYFQILRGAISAMWPGLLIFFVSMTIVAILLYLWLK